MPINSEDIEKITKCICLQNNHEIEIEDLCDPNFHNIDCPVHGKKNYEENT